MKVSYYFYLKSYYLHKTVYTTQFLVILIWLELLLFTYTYLCFLCLFRMSELCENNPYVATATSRQATLRIAQYSLSGRSEWKATACDAKRAETLRGIWSISLIRFVSLKLNKFLVVKSEFVYGGIKICDFEQSVFDV